MTQVHEALGSTPHLFTVAEYRALTIAERTELIEGVIYDVVPKNEPHILAELETFDVLNVSIAVTTLFAPVL